MPGASSNRTRRPCTVCGRGTRSRNGRCWEHGHGATVAPLALTGGAWVPRGPVLVWRPVESTWRRAAREDREWTPADARRAHTRYVAGLRDDWTLTGERVYKRWAKRRQRAGRAS